MSGDEVEGDTCFCGVIDHLADPAAAGSGWTTDTIIRRDAFDCADSSVVKLEVLGLISCPEQIFQVGLVPDFEVPLAHFVATVTVGPMLYQLLDQALPFRVIPRRCHIAFPPEDGFISARQPLRHKTKLNEWSHACVQNGVVNRVNVLEVINGTSVRVFRVDAELVLEKSVHSQILKPALKVYDTEVSLPIGAQRLRRASSADYELWKRIARTFKAKVVGRNHTS